MADVSEQGIHTYGAEENYVPSADPEYGGAEVYLPVWMEGTSPLTLAFKIER